jgi:Rrf2 family nitric oxide-sensitive transcriptional repressor
VRLTTFTDYSLRVLIFVATRPQGRSTIADIASAYGISEHHLVKVVHRLGREGLLVNKRGRGGGLELAKPASDINVGEVVRVIEDLSAPVACFGEASPECAIAPVCRLAGVLDEALRAFHAVLDRYTLADLVRNRAALGAILHRFDFRAPITG